MSEILKRRKELLYCIVLISNVTAESKLWLNVLTAKGDYFLGYLGVFNEKKLLKRNKITVTTSNLLESNYFSNQNTNIMKLYSYY